MYKYKCSKCGYDEWAPAFVVEEFADMDEFMGEDNSGSKRKGMPVMVCPNCDADFFYTGEKEKQ